jgi:geranylgeranyl diphosphate synthase, type II
MMPMNSMNDCITYMEKKAKIVNEELQRYMGGLAGAPALIQSSMSYSLLSGGKRIRPVLLLAANDMMFGSEKRALPFACALEMIHTYSLIHDDLPAMDNDTLRRGKPTNHVVYGEAVAILGGDALLNLAYEVMITECVQQGPSALMTAQYISEASGCRGLIGGQCLDISATGQFTGEEALKEMHMMKTGALLKAAVLSGIALNNPGDDVIDAMRNYGYHLGMLFQITDDILDCVGSAAELGKSVGKDKDENKTTYVTLYGIDKARDLARDHAERATKSLKGIEGVEFFRLLAQYILERKK